MGLTKEIEEIKEIKEFLQLAFLDFEELHNIPYSFDIKYVCYNDNKNVREYGSRFNFKTNPEYYSNDYKLKVYLENKPNLDREIIVETLSDCVKKFNILSDVEIDFSSRSIYDYGNHNHLITFRLKSTIKYRLYIDEEEHNVLKEVNRLIPLRYASLSKNIGKLTPSKKRISISYILSRSSIDKYPSYIPFIKIRFDNKSAMKPKKELEAICLELREKGINIQIIEYSSSKFSNRKTLIYSLIL